MWKIKKKKEATAFWNSLFDNELKTKKILNNLKLKEKQICHNFIFQYVGDTTEQLNPNNINRRSATHSDTSP